MKMNRILRIARLMLALVIAMSVPALAADNAATAKAAKPTSVEVSASKATVLPGAALFLTATVEPEAASQSVTWKSSNTAVATVNSAGRVVAKKRGTASITATTKTGGKQASCVVTVSTAFDGVNVHFYGIGNANYQDQTKLPGSKWDVETMAALYAAASFGVKVPSVHAYTDQTGSGILSVLDAMVSDEAISEDDITVFYYSGHGVVSSNSQYHGALVGVERSSATYSNLVTVDQVQRKLDQVPGTIVVILDSCYSGQFIKSKGTSLQSTAAASNNAWVKALSQSRATNYTGKALTDSANKVKYRILTAASNNQTSAALTDTTDNTSFSLFTYCLNAKLTNMGADSNGDKVITLKEAFDKVYKSVASFKKTWNAIYPKDKLEQVTCVWPSNNNFPIYARN